MKITNETYGDKDTFIGELERERVSRLERAEDTRLKLTHRQRQLLKGQADGIAWAIRQVRQWQVTPHPDPFHAADRVPEVLAAAERAGITMTPPPRTGTVTYLGQEDQS